MSGAENWPLRVALLSLFDTRLRAAAIRSWSLSKKEDIVGSAHVSWSVDFRSRTLKSCIMSEKQVHIRALPTFADEGHFPVFGNRRPLLFKLEYTGLTLTRNCLHSFHDLNRLRIWAEMRL